MNNKKNTLITLAVLSSFLLLTGFGTINPALQNLAEFFPDIPYSTVVLLSTLPYLFAIPFTVISGALAGSKVKYRTLLIFSILLFMIGGASPYFLNDFYMILVSRAIFGIGLGILSPIPMSLVIKLFDGQTRANMMGLGNVVQNIGGIILQLLGGTLCSINVRFTWLAHLLGILSLVIIIVGLPEPEKIVKAPGEKVKMPMGVFQIAFLLGSCFLLFFPTLINMSSIISMHNIGNAATAGVVLSIFTLGGLIGGIMFGKIYKLISKYTAPTGMSIIVVGMAIIYFTANVATISLGAFVIGFGFTLVVSSMFMEIGVIVPPSGTNLASGIIMAFLNLVTFLCTFYLALLIKFTGNSSPKFPIFVDMIVLFGITIIYFIIKSRTKTSVESPPIQS